MKPSDFWARVDCSGECWLWTGSKTSMGYGNLRADGRSVLAHRHALSLSGVEVPRSSVVRHHCDTPACVNPAHLAVGTHKDNTADMMRRGRGRHGCVSGSRHPGAVLRESDVALMKLLMECGVRGARLAALYGVSQAKVSQIRLGQSWRHVSALEAP